MSELKSGDCKTLGELQRAINKILTEHPEEANVPIRYDMLGKDNAQIFERYPVLVTIVTST